MSSPIAFLATARDQDDLERDIGRQAESLLAAQADARDAKRLARTEASKSRCLARLQRLRARLAGPGSSAVKNPVRDAIADVEARVAALDGEIGQICARVEGRRGGAGADAVVDGGDGEGGGGRLPMESRRAFLIRTGKITPFSTAVVEGPRLSARLADVMFDAEGEGAGEEGEEVDGVGVGLGLGGEAGLGPKSHTELLLPGGFDDESAAASDVVEDDEELARRLQAEEDGMAMRATRRRAAAPMERAAKRRRVEPSQEPSSGSDSDAFKPDVEDATWGGDTEAGDVDDELVRDTQLQLQPHRKRGARRKGKTSLAATEEQQEDLAGVDDGDEGLYQARLQSWVRRRSEARRKAKNRLQEDEDAIEVVDDDNEEEWYKPHPTRPDAVFDGGLRIPGDVYPSLFDYQKTGVQWLWELYTQQVGGIIGDEMGLGKTIQIISFLAALHHSKKLTKPVIVVTPATVMKQWVNEFHRWWPPLRVSILHSSGSGMLDMRREREIEADLETDAWDSRRPSKGHGAAKKILQRVVRDGHVLVTTYSGLQTYANLLIPQEWEYAVLDEGHKIRNPNTAITIHCKELKTSNRVILSGTPMQNNLTELWSLFDFVFPMRLGTLVTFRQQFEFPIKQGGYANASNLQVETAMKCAEALKDTISAYLLQRLKVDVARDLPKKSERVLFCRLTQHQRDMYAAFLKGDDMNAILHGKRHALFGVDILRKICNHPDLTEHKVLGRRTAADYGDAKKSGKMQVVKGLLEMWKTDGHKTLLFAQHRIMLDILEKFVSRLDGFRHVRMDGNTSIKDRQDMVDEFNKNADVHVFLLTTKVGGLGVNLTGADRVIIFDPDWNPSTDVQARERAWRLGQKREVEIYRLMTAGTIEEKIYHRQIFKQFLTNKILKDAKQRQTFQLRDLHDLFSLGDDEATETSKLFKGTEVKFKEQEKGESEPSEGAAAPDKGKALAVAITSLAGVSRQEDFASAADDDDGAGQDANGAATTPSSSSALQSASAGGGNDNNGGEARSKPTQSDRVLSALLSRSGVQSAVEHDAILASNSAKAGKVQPDADIIRREARRVAANAARELQRAGEIARTIPAGVPTWTGEVGEAGRPESARPGPAGIRGSGIGRGRGVGGPSSSAVLAQLARRQGNESRWPSGPQSEQSPRGKELLEMIRNFLCTHGGAVYTQMVVDHFSRFCGTERQTEEFKAMLKRIAVMEKGRSKGRARWVLKEEFRRE